MPLLPFLRLSLAATTSRAKRGWARWRTGARVALAFALAMACALPAAADGVPDTGTLNVTNNYLTVIKNEVTPVVNDVILAEQWQIIGKGTFKGSDGILKHWSSDNTVADAAYAATRASTLSALHTWLEGFAGATVTYYVNEGQTAERRDLVGQSYEEVQTDETTDVVITLDTHGAVEGVDYLAGDPNDPNTWIAVTDVTVDVNQVTTITKFIDATTTNSYNHVKVWTIDGYRAVQDDVPQPLFTVSASAGTGGHVTPATQSVASGVAANLTLTPDFGYQVGSIGGTCPTGARSGNTLTTGAVTADCTVTVSFAAVAGPITHFQGPSATGSGTVVADLSGGGASCGFDGTPTLIIPAVAGAGTLPVGITFPHGLLGFKTKNCTVGGTVTLTLQWPNLPAGSAYYKWGPEAGNPTPHWYSPSASISGNTVTLTIKDGGAGDDDGSANGAIVDPGGPGVGGGGPVSPPGVTAIPTLGEWALVLLGLMLAGLGALRLRPVRA